MKIGSTRDVLAAQSCDFIEVRWANFMRPWLLLLSSSICMGQVAAPAVPQFEDIGKHAGLNVPNISSKDEYYIVESMSGGAGFIDCDNDGKLEIATVNGWRHFHFTSVISLRVVP